MGGPRLIRTARPARVTRPAVTLLAAASLFAALLLCLGPHGAAPSARHHEGAQTARTAPADAPVAHDCPYDRDTCGRVPHLSPAVLTVPPLGPPPQPAGLARFGADHAPAPVTGSEARPRAPGLHVLQVLRT